MISRRSFLQHTAAISTVGVGVTAVAVAKPAMSPREQAIWHIRELERLALEDGAREVMVTLVGRFHSPKFKCKTLMLTHSGELDDFGSSDFLRAGGIA